MCIVICSSVLAWIIYADFVSSLAKLGAMILLFVVGLEFKPNENLISLIMLILD